MTAHYVYRVYDVHDQLIYVGCTRNLVVRLRAHELNSWWAYQAVKVVAKVYPDKWAGLIAERSAIRAEKPRWNLFHRGAREKWDASDYCDYVTSAVNMSDAMTPSRQRRLLKLALHYRNRFGHELPVQIPEAVA